VVRTQHVASSAQSILFVSSVFCSGSLWVPGTSGRAPESPRNPPPMALGASRGSPEPPGPGPKNIKAHSCLQSPFKHRGCGGQASGFSDIARNRSRCLGDLRRSTIARTCLLAGVGVYLYADKDIHILNRTYSRKLESRFEFRFCAVFRPNLAPRPLQTGRARTNMCRTHLKSSPETNSNAIP
jgi:hypothetical protein